jgi:hypothetical protein
METPRHTAIPESPEQRRANEARVTIERAERVWRRQVGNEQAGVPSGPPARFRWLLLAVALAAIVFLLFQRLGQVG